MRSLKTVLSAALLVGLATTAGRLTWSASAT